MAEEDEPIILGGLGIRIRNERIPAAFFRHMRPGKEFVVLGDGPRKLMNVGDADLGEILRAYHEYKGIKEGGGRCGAKCS